MRRWFGRRIETQSCPWRRAARKASSLNGWILVAILLLLALGAGHFGRNSVEDGIHLVVRVTGGAQANGSFWRKP